MQQRQLNDKIKYWQYKINEKKKNKQQKSAKPIIKLKEFPQKINPHTHVLKPKHSKTYTNHQKIFNDTINKLKNILQQNKPLPNQKKNTQNKIKHKNKSALKVNDESKNKIQSDRIFKTLSTTINSKLKLEKSNKINLENISKSKSPSLSITKTKSKSKRSNKLKSTLNLSKQKNTKDNSPTKDKKVKVSKRQRGQYSKLQSGNMNMNMDMQLSDEVQLLLHKTQFLGKSELVDRVESKSFKLWEQIQQRQYNKKKKNAKKLIKYLKAFAKAIKYQKIQSKIKNKENILIFTQKKHTVHSDHKFQRIIKTQESKLLELKFELNRLKYSDNINDRLQLIIEKVNKNIEGLQNLQDINKIRDESQEIKPEIKEFEQKQVEVQLVKLNDQILNSTQIHKIYSDQISHSIHYLNSPEFQNQDHSKPQVSSRKSLNPVLDSLTISNDKSSEKSLKIFQSKDYLSEQDIKQSYLDSNHLLDPRFMNLTLDDNSKDESEGILCKQITPKNKQNQHSLKESLLLENSQKCKVEFSLVSIISNKKGKKVEIDEMNSDSNLLSNKQRLNEQNCSVNFNSTNLLQFSDYCTELNQTQEQKYNNVIQFIQQEIVSEIISFLANRKIINRFTNNDTYIHLIQSQQSDDSHQLPIQSSNQYLLQHTLQVLNYAQNNINFIERLKKPLGVLPIINLRYIRLNFIQDYFLEPYQIYSEENYEKEMAQQIQIAEKYAYIIQQSHFETFETQSEYQQNELQIIFNKCLYQIINQLLDELRPFGKQGFPPFLYTLQNFRYTSTAAIKQTVIKRLQSIINSSFGVFNEEDIQVSEHKIQIVNHFSRKMDLLVKEVMQEFQVQNDYSMEHYELMVLIEMEVIKNEAEEIMRLMCKNRLFQ